ncbi:hypothetical protein TRAPUB_7442 [Trametes pubescens]|uniref:HAT C-terminal dimerisation domain-containing protein n=1 Tax=Trametes pubescens TaxID=154538 RepID=A0A1M2V3M2_TRAPU|nr:hypothetical protein TRAPUB_7442 [Trametes pubescens]
MSQSQSTKRGRETAAADEASSPGSIAATQAQARVHARPRISDVASPPKKRQKDTVYSSDASDGGANASGGDDATDGGIKAIASVARRARRPRLMSAEEKRRRFKEKYSGMTPEQILATVSEGWRSSVYTHYRPPQIIPGPNGTSTYRFICKKYPTKHVDRADSEDSTGNLRRHADCCDPDETAESDLLSIYAHGVTYTAQRMRLLLALWCARRHRPYAIVEDPEIQEVFRMLYSRVYIPSRTTVSRDVRTLHRDMKLGLMQLLAGLSCRLHLCVDGWTSPNVLSFLGITVHWHWDGEIRHVILDFVRLTSAHTRAYLAEKVVECLKEYGIEEKVLVVTCDNAESNAVMLREMAKLVPGFRGPQVRVRCFGHVLNLVVKAILSQFTQKKRASKDSDNTVEAANITRELVNLDDGEPDEDDDNDDHEGDASREAADDAILDTLDDDNPDLILTHAEISAGLLVYEKIMKLSKKVWNSPSIRTELAQLSAAAGLDYEVLIRPVSTRWNTVTEVIERALAMRDVLGDLCDKVQFNRRDGARLRRFMLTDEDWKLLDQLHRLLGPFLFATNQISSSTRALVHEVIPYIDILTEHLDDYTADLELAPSVRAAAQRGRAVLNKYYERTDESIIYRIAMILHPAYKTQYFRDHRWEEEWIEEAKTIIREEWEANYKPADDTDATPAVAGDSAEGSGVSTASKKGAAVVPKANEGKGKAREDHAPSGVSDKAPKQPAGTGRLSAQASANAAMFASVSKNGSRKRANAFDPLEAYLETPPISSVEEPLHHWNLILESSRDDSPDAALARMALDFLSAPAASTDVEQAFSRGHLTVSRLRHSLGEDSVRAGTVVGSWARIPDLLDEELLAKSLKPPTPCPVKKTAAVVAVPASSRAQGGPKKGVEVLVID